MKGAHFPPTFPHPRFLERKLGKELCAKLRFASGDAALRGGRGGCSFLLAQKGTKKAPGSVAPTNISPKASVHSRHPWTPFTKAGHFGREVSSGGQNQDLFPFYSRALGPFFIKICKLLPSIVHRLMPAYLFGAAVVGRTSRHGYDRAGGVISTLYLLNSCFAGPSGPRQEERKVLS